MGFLLRTPVQTVPLCSLRGGNVGTLEDEFRPHLADILCGQHVWPCRWKPDTTLHADEVVAVEGLAMGKRVHRKPHMQRTRPC
jgi:hypothetical protein